MKRVVIFMMVMLFAATAATDAFAQQVRITLRGDANLLEEGKYVALEVGGKIVIGFDEEFTEIITSTGKYFAARYKEDDSDWYIYDRNGEEVELGGGSYRQELMAQGKVVLEVQEFTKILSDEVNWNKTGCWVFIVKNNGLYGTLCLGTWKENGKQNLEMQQFIPYEYSYISPDSQLGIVQCTTKSGAVHYRAWSGQMVQ
ncbi:MAG: hypothetical protein LBU44_06410 [Mediterranea sp.]|nr:hypothetical protein [Mediterranea sp.]